MKILHVLNTDRYSGAENVACQIILSFRHNPDVQMVYCSKDGQIRSALQERGIAFAPVSALSVSELKRVILEQKPDVIHAHDMRASFIAALACGKIPLISHIHNNSYESRSITPKAVAYLAAAMKARHIFWVSQSSLDGYVFKGICRKKSSVLYNIIDSDALREKAATDLQEYDYDVVYLGRLTYPKNPQRLLHVMKKVAQKCADVRIAVIGSGELDDEVKQLSAELGLQKNVHFLGFQSNPYKVLQSAKVMVMTSRWEGTPMCSLEAMALGTPIVSTPVDGLQDLVQNGFNGYLTDDDDALAERISGIITDSSLYSSLSANALETDKRVNDKDNYRQQISTAYRL